MRNNKTYNIYKTYGFLSPEELKNEILEAKEFLNECEGIPMDEMDEDEILHDVAQRINGNYWDDFKMNTGGCKALNGQYAITGG